MYRAAWVYFGVGLCALPGDDAKLVLQLGHTEEVTSVAFSPDGRQALTGSKDKTVRLWDVATGSAIRVLQGHSSKVTAVAFSPDGRQVLTGSDDDTARVWEVATGKETRRLEGHSRNVQAVAFSPDGRQVLTGSDDETARVWDVATGKETRRLEGHSGPVTALAFTPDGRWALTGSNDHTSRLWDVTTGREIRRLEGRSYGGITSVAISSDGLWAIEGSRSETARLWEVATGKEVRLLEGRSRGMRLEVTSVAFSPDGRWALTGSARNPLDPFGDAGDPTARVWDVATGKEIRQFIFEGVNSLAFAPDGRTVLTGGRDKMAHLWDATTGKEIQRFSGQSTTLDSATFSTDGRWIVMLGEVARVWDPSTGKQVQRLETDFGRHLAFSSDLKKALYGDYSGRAAVLDVAVWGKEISRFEGHDESVRAGAFSPDGRSALTGSWDKTASLWDVATGKEIRRFEGHSDWVNAVAFSPDTRSVLTGSRDMTARLWDVTTGREIRRFGGDDHVLAVAFSPDGRLVLTGGGETAQLWDLASGREIQRFEGHSSGVLAVAFSPDGNSAITGGIDGSAFVWDVATGKQKVRLDGHAGWVQSVTYARDGRVVMTGNDDGTARLWDTASGKELAMLVSFGEGGWVVVDPNGRFDTNILDGGAPLHWILDSDPLRPLPLEIFMRDYYTPRLLPRILIGDKFPDLPKIADIKNRVQPDVEIVKVEPTFGAPNRVTVSVRAASKADDNKQASGLQDLRLFRNGQVVGYLEGSLKDDTYIFRNIQLPLSDKNAVFSAYAFNTARIKSPTVQKDLAYTPASQPKPRAFLVQVGVNHYQASGCDLRYAVNDAHRLHAALEQRLKARDLDVHAVELVATNGASNATKADIRTALDAIAKQATPDDVLVLSFSGHGYTSPDGMFYVFPSDIQGSCSDPNADLLKGAISADELAEWLRPIDAGEMTFILDACYSAKSVEANDFKPGPMGSRGLGQLAYDKRMRILAASQSDATAIEDSKLEQGLLSYVLTEQGLKESRADWKPVDQQITMGEWLAYAVDQVPKLNQSDKPNEAGRGITLLNAIRRSQVPSVFDFAQKDALVIQQ